MSDSLARDSRSVTAENVARSRDLAEDMNRAATKVVRGLASAAGQPPVDPPAYLRALPPMPRPVICVDGLIPARDVALSDLLGCMFDGPVEFETVMIEGRARRIAGDRLSLDVWAHWRETGNTVRWESRGNVVHPEPRWTDRA